MTPIKAPIMILGDAGFGKSKALAAAALDYHRGAFEGGITLFVSDRMNPVQMAQAMGFFSPDQVPRHFYFCPLANAVAIADYFSQANVSLFIDCAEMAILRPTPQGFYVAFQGEGQSDIASLLEKGVLKGITALN